MTKHTFEIDIETLKRERAHIVANQPPGQATDRWLGDIDETIGWRERKLAEWAATGYR